MKWIIAYDIADKKRLTRAHRYLRNIAIPLQNSTFLFSGSLKALETHFAVLTANLNAKEDDVRAYPLYGKLYNLGQRALPEGILLIDFPETHLARLPENP
ncbi:CRISPR-associated endonuclease Cas2 [Kingella negevensis]|uniref:CRISPR-associated endoribonuclease Cas2 n=1 Tax=Kingella negevensis TaxID=1522312 RepID=A0A238TBK4_9NEIS|nr:CRISPR-associated endonuclease Cas2 [Kingella negevensis]MDK4681155.1 CRISPR-associated endonuclease Cas2 [Kingella negevensis]MDK4683358.1 CRISPR-associated endonuclease Cas2 [Kingella negevensis]MDK4685390.1 CRISPR-associated endonuclease Cas2 [Kingella negevensis]MDK4691512.1 CRISPR-associated endonuclease Cas2 [Kingella negevensis]MDK4693337.1 CRISPR-associated endonuclease Cas2 [Kingella negevensis]